MPGLLMESDIGTRMLRSPGHLRRTAHRPGPVPPGTARQGRCALWAGVSYREAVSPPRAHPQGAAGWGSRPRVHGPRALLGAFPEGANGMLGLRLTRLADGKWVVTSPPECARMNGPMSGPSGSFPQARGAARCSAIPRGSLREAARCSRPPGIASPFKRGSKGGLDEICGANR